MRLLHRDVELDFRSKRTGNLQIYIYIVILLFTLLYRFFDTRITAKLKHNFVANFL